MKSEKITRIALLPVGGILDRYLARGFIRIFAISLLCTTVLYLIVDFFDKIDNLLQAGAPLWSSVRYFLYKIPLLISRVFAFAALFSTLFSLGMLSRSQEITAMRSSGLSLRRISLPLFLLSFLICALTFFWNEALVPIFTGKAQYIYKTEVKKKQPKNLVGSKDIWIRGDGTFIRVDRFDTNKLVLEGVSVYLLNRDFTLRGLIEAPWARWNGTGWEAKRGTEWLFLPNGQMRQRKLDSFLPLAETPEDFKLLAREPEEFSFFDLRKQIAELKAKGFDTTQDEVDLQVKLALPLVSPLMVLLAIPFALRPGPGGSMALSFGLTMLIGFGYWLVLAFSVSLGHSGALPSLVAAWLPNLILALVGLFFSTAEE
ncbi:MAG: LPS export ABC transporter permease LptG [Deltaproteobacteria bacterium]|nr:LPS export ABC transporter permease LptG [Deltaproteobacteria bacterium]